MAQQLRKGWAADLLPRLLSAIAMVAVAGQALYWAVWSLVVLIIAGAMVLAWEWTRLCGEAQFGLSGLTQALCLFVIIVAAATGTFGLALALIPLAVIAAWLAAGRGGVGRPCWSAFGPLYVGLPCVAIVWLRGGDDAGRTAILWLLAVVSAADIGAYFAGRIIGGPKLAPAISPNKTWAGLAGAVVGAAAAGLAVSQIMVSPGRATALAVAGGVLAVVAQIGDLFESAIKRRFGVKNSSEIIPGHGGMFDRVDGLLAAASVLALWQWTTEGSVLSWR